MTHGIGYEVGSPERCGPVHFFPRFSREAAEGPLGDALRDMAVPHRIHATEVKQAYRRRITLLLLGYPRLALSAFATAWASMVGGGDSPAAAVISSDVEALVFALVRLLPFAAKPRFVFMPFIFTERESSLVNRLRLAYYRAVLRRVSLAICHSRLETERYATLFAGCRTEFRFVPWGTDVPLADPCQPPANGGGALPTIVAAGRSGRDYPLLVEAVAGLPCRLTIICNARHAVAGIEPTDQVEILQRCFAQDYLARLQAADIVVVPLRVADISAGQMVLIQAMASARPLVVTDTPTVRDYLRHGDTAMLVPKGEVAALRAALEELLADRRAAADMGRRAQGTYGSRFNLRAHLQSLLAVVHDHLRTDAGEHVAVPRETRRAA